MLKGKMYETAQTRYTKLCGKAVLDANGKGFAEPFYLTATDTKGAVLVMRADYRDYREQFEVTAIRTDPPGGSMSIPVMLILKDAQGRTMRRTLT